jgi:hypothetical protein
MVPYKFTLFCRRFEGIYKNRVEDGDSTDLQNKVNKAQRKSSPKTEATFALNSLKISYSAFVITQCVLQISHDHRR